MSGFDPTLVLLVLVVGIGAILLLCVLMCVMPLLFRKKPPSNAKPQRLRPDRFTEGYRAGWKARDDVAASEATRFSSLLDAPIQPYDGS